jgi:hypothetical protein
MSDSLYDTAPSDVIRRHAAKLLVAPALFFSRIVTLVTNAQEPHSQFRLTSRFPSDGAFQ